MSLKNVSEINSYLFLSGVINEKKCAALQKLGVTLVIDASNRRVKLTEKNNLEVMSVDIGDHTGAKISRFFHMVADKIAENRKKEGKTVVHCMAGVSRSSTLVIAYLMREENLSLNEAFNLVKQKRPIANPNDGFWHQLEEFEQQLVLARSEKSN